MMKDAVKRMQSKRVLVVGDAMLDHNVIGECTRLSPEGPYKVLQVKRHEYVLGGAANVAHNVRSLGARAWLCYAAGRDEAGRRLREAGERAGLSMLPVEESDRKTVEKTRLFAGDIRMDPRIDEESASGLRAESEERLMEHARKVLGEVDLVILSDYSKGVFGGRLGVWLADAAKKAGVLVVAAPKPGVFSKERRFGDVDVVIVNHREAGMITGLEYAGVESLREIGARMKEAARAGSVAITCGRDGMFYCDRDGGARLVPTKARRVSDVTGAGDTSAAVLALAISTGLGMEDAVKVANYAAGIVVEKPGTATVTVDELLARMSEDGEQ